MNMLRLGTLSLALCAASAALLTASVASAHTTNLSCTTSLDNFSDGNFPKGCELVLTGSPMVFLNVSDGTDLHDITITGITFTHAGGGAMAELIGTDDNLTTGTSSFDFTTGSVNESDTGLPDPLVLGQTYDYTVTGLDIEPGSGLDTLPTGWQLSLAPSPGSAGHLATTDNGDGTYTISSFFDVFTELSLDGGATFTPQSGEGPTVYQAQDAPAPEPATIALFGAGLAGLGLLRKRARA